MRCRRPRSVCYCAALPRLDTQTRIVILQHPRERDMPIGTARMASLCLPHAELHVGVDWSEHAELFADPERPPILLYPSADARDILREPPRGPVTLVVVDGTWSQAKTVVRDNPILHALPRYAFATPEPSQYRIRKEPRAEYCSTIEALMHVLGVLEGDPERFRALLAPFEAMVEAQLHARATRGAHRSRVPRAPVPLSAKLPAALRSRYANLVLVVGEANAWPYLDGVKPPDELVQWAALRPASGEVFAAIAAPAGALSPSTAFHTELADDVMRAGAPLAEVIAAFARWLRPTDVIGSWGHYGPNLFIAAGGALPARLDLRALAQRVLHRKLGSLEAFAATLAATATPPPAPGRGGKRLAALARVVAQWRAELGA
jgi:DTW domain-containing protein YfiP